MSIRILPITTDLSRLMPEQADAGAVNDNTDHEQTSAARIILIIQKIREIIQ